MRELRYVKQATDAGKVVVETTDGGEKFLLGIDLPLRDAVRSDLPRVAGLPEPRLGPREIQVRVRAGESPQQVAEDSHVRLEWIMRFASPVVAERARIANEARRAHARRSTTEGKSVVFGEAVDRRFAAHDIDPATVRWDARRGEDGQWIVSAHWLGCADERIAEWSFQLAARTVAPLDDSAADLLSDRPIDPVAPDASQLSLVAAPRLGAGVVAVPDLIDADTGPLPAVDDELFDQDAETSPASAAGAGIGEALAVDEPPLPMQLSEAAPRRSTRRAPRAASRSAPGRSGRPSQDKSSRPQVPSWDDIVLGVRRKPD
ncbi:MAG: septation protein SepH [Actinomycetota bacterium]|nr:septation protein SepH [Actinomycetota bacterium]